MGRVRAALVSRRRAAPRRSSRLTDARQAASTAETGQAVPLIAVVIVVVGVVGLGIVRLGRGVADATRAQAGADAAALAGVLDGQTSAASLAHANGAELTSFHQVGDDVVVAVRWGRSVARARARRLADPGAADGPAGTAQAGWAFPVPHDAVPAASIGRPHHDYPALDLPVPEGTPVYALTSGRVQWVTDDRCGTGINVMVTNRVRFVYCHGRARAVPNGAVVHAGQQVLWSGNTGNSTGPHLHIGVFVDGQTRCPQPLVTALFVGRVPPPLSALPARGCIA